MPLTREPQQVLEATEGFVCMIDGEKLIVQEGITRISASHPIAERYPSRFRPVDLEFADDAEATANPGQRQRRAVNRGPETAKETAR